ncbi:importin-11-like isoform X2 [Antedon mediterranea]|uniref:importin-11-like isoform X2 n=1 Tax=Antedon mediterranea TaxID=105859 RepID=UPI003AF72A20
MIRSIIWQPDFDFDEIAMDLESAKNVVLDTLIEASSQNVSLLKPAEQKLKSWEIQPGFYPILQSIFSTYSIDVNVRWLAVLYFKNGIDRYWRRTAPNAINEEDKETIRRQLLTRFDEPAPQVALQLAVVISKIARVDCPRNWPELVPTIMEGLKQNDDFLQRRLLLTLHHVIKTLSAKRLPADKKTFREFTRTFFNFIAELWNNHTETFLNKASTNIESAVTSCLEPSQLSLKIAKKLMVHGMTEISEFPNALTTIEVVFQRLEQMLQIRRQIEDYALKEKLEKKIIHLVKVLSVVQINHPVCFIRFIQRALTFTSTYVFTQAAENLNFERFIIECMNIMKAIVTCDEYKVVKLIEAKTEPSRIQASKIKEEFFTESVLTEIGTRLLTSYFLLTPEDLYNWENDPEDFTADEVGESWKYGLRPCTEKLFLALFHAYESMTPLLLKLVESVQGETDVENMTSILQKEAVYNAVGLSAFELYDEVDFDQWFCNQLLKELQNKHPRYKIIRRRVINVVGQWLDVKLSPSLHPLVYQAVLPLLSPQEDLVVRITAAKTLKIAIDDFEFRSENFEPYLETSFSLLFQLLQQVSECDTKMHVLHVLSFVIERSGACVQPHVSHLVQYLPLLWEESSEHDMLRCAILSTLVHLVQSLGTLSVNLYPFLIPIIKFSTDLNQPPHVYLLDDGIELWQEMLRCAPSLTPDMLQLFDNMPPLLELGSENLKKCFMITTSYLLLNPEEFLKTYSHVIFQGCANLIHELKPEGVVVICKLIETVFKLFPIRGPEIFRPLLPTIFEGILEKEAYPILMSIYLSLFARLILKNQSFFFKFLEEVGTMWNQQPEDILEQLLSFWCEYMVKITQPERRKLTALAFTTLLPCTSRAVVTLFPDLFYPIVEVFHDVMREDNGSQFDYLVMGDRDDLDDEYETEHDKRKRQLSLQDPVFNTPLHEYTRAQLMVCEQAFGAERFQSLIGSVDKEIREQLEEFLK